MARTANPDGVVQAAALAASAGLRTNLTSEPTNENAGGWKSFVPMARCVESWPSFGVSSTRVPGGVPGAMVKWHQPEPTGVGLDVFDQPKRIVFCVVVPSQRIAE